MLASSEESSGISQFEVKLGSTLRTGSEVTMPENIDLDNREIPPLSQQYSSGYLRINKPNVQVEAGRYLFFFEAESLDNRYDFPDSSHAP